MGGYFRKIKKNIVWKDGLIHP